MPIYTFLFLIGQYTINKQIFYSETGVPLKPNFTGIVFLRSSINISHFILIGQKHGHLYRHSRFWLAHQFQSKIFVY
jgi:hypothetical protein